MKTALFVINGAATKPSKTPKRIGDGGTCIAVGLANEWRSKLSVSVLTCPSGLASISSDLLPSIQRIILPVSEWWYRSLALLYLRKTFLGIKEIISKKYYQQFDFIYSSSDFWPDALVAAVAKFKNHKIKWIAGFYLFAPAPWQKDSPYHTNLKRYLVGLIYWATQQPIYWLVRRFADVVLITSIPDQKKFVTAKRDASRVIVVQGGVDISASEKYLKSDDIIPVHERKYDACFVGRFHDQKGVLVLVDIWQLVTKIIPSAQLAMIGAGPLEVALRKRIMDNGLENNISILGFKNGQEKYDVFKQSKMMVHPAVYDSGGMAAAEGMAWGLPGVSFDLEALKTYYPQGMIKTECFNNQYFADNILKLLSDNTLYLDISSKAHELILDVWDWSKRSENIYNKIFC